MAENTDAVELNPYRAPEVSEFQVPTLAKNTSASKNVSPVAAGLAAWIGTGIAGGIFGFGLFGFFGLFFGLIYATAAAIPVTLVVYSLLYAFCSEGLSRSRAVAFGAVCGGVTGLGTTVMLFRFSEFPIALVAMVIGAAISAVSVTFGAPAEQVSLTNTLPPSTWADLD